MNKITWGWLCAALISVMVADCGGDGGQGPATVPISNSNVPISNSKSSYGIARDFAKASLINWAQFRGNEFLLARSIADLDGDGILDVVVAPGVFLSTVGTPMRVYKGLSGTFHDNTSSWINGAIPSLVHARKMLLGDFNADGRKDIFVCAHGYDAAPFPGTVNALLLSDGNGQWVAANQSWSSYVGFHHGCTSDDIDNDGDIDIFVTDSKTMSYFLINDGHGNFVRDTTRLPISLQKATPIFTAELFDLDDDGNTDLVVGGAEGAQPTMIFWGDGTGSFSDARATTIPAVTGWQNALTYAAEDIDGDGIKELIVGRTKGNAGAADFYQGYYMQVLKISKQTRGLTDVTGAWAASLNNTAPGILRNNGVPTWVEWVWVTDYDGDGKPDLIASDEWIGNFWAKNTGSGFGNWQKLP